MIVVQRRFLHRKQSHYNLLPCHKRISRPHVHLHDMIKIHYEEKNRITSGYLRCYLPLFPPSHAMSAG